MRTAERVSAAYLKLQCTQSASHHQKSCTHFRFVCRLRGCSPCGDDISLPFCLLFCDTKVRKTQNKSKRRSNQKCCIKSIILHAVDKPDVRACLWRWMAHWAHFTFSYAPETRSAVCISMFAKREVAGDILIIWFYNSLGCTPIK